MTDSTELVAWEDRPDSIALVEFAALADQRGENPRVSLVLRDFSPFELVFWERLEWDLRTGLERLRSTFSECAKTESFHDSPTVKKRDSCSQHFHCWKHPDSIESFAKVTNLHHLHFHSVPFHPLFWPSQETYAARRHMRFLLQKMAWKRLLSASKFPNRKPVADAISASTNSISK